MFTLNKEVHKSQILNSVAAMWMWTNVDAVGGVTPDLHQSKWDPNPGPGAVSWEIVFKRKLHLSCPAHLYESSKALHIMNSLSPLWLFQGNLRAGINCWTDTPGVRSPLFSYLSSMEAVSCLTTMFQLCSGECKAILPVFPFSGPSRVPTLRLPAPAAPSLLHGDLRLSPFWLWYLQAEPFAAFPVWFPARDWLPKQTGLLCFQRLNNSATVHS